MALTRAEALRGHLAMLVFSGLVAGSFSFGKLIANDIDPAALTALRFAIAGALIGAAAALGPGLAAHAFRAPWRFLILGGLFGAYFVLMFEALKTADPVATAAIFTLTPVMAAGFGWLFLRQLTTGRMALALAVGAAGALWVIFRGDPAALIAFDLGRGEAVFFVAALAHAAYTPLVRRFNRGEPALVFTFGMMMAALVLLLIYGLPSIRATDWAALPARVWWVVLYLAIFASAMSFVILQYAAMRLPSAKVMAYTYLTPCWVIGWEIALGNAAPRGLVLGGIALTVLALVLLLKEDG
ncbi:DMT family transporter [Rhodovulum strictum]|uniref:EamA family transporter n=1 Tax=Rhodovulum strictum TaxID=58314 RepID=A0A844AZT9_9RHOB|nr:DMT family transporter [Rhodovulum strictum]MRH19636.1 EamA family transporter [Rhodovulum strictum]